MTKKRLILTAVFVLLAVGAAAEKAKGHWDHTFKAKPGGTVKVDAGFQDIHVTIAPGDTVAVTVDISVSTWPKDSEKVLQEYTPVFREEGDTLLIRSRRKSSFSMGKTSMDGSIVVTMPPGMHISLDTGSGDCRVDGDTGGMNLNCDTGSGDIRVDASCKGFRADTGSGDVRAKLKGSVGRVKIDTGSGDVDFSGESADFSADTGSGEVTAHLLSGSANIDTGSGDVKASWSRLAKDATVRVDTGSGSARLLFPTGSDFAGRVETSSGDVVCDFPGTSQDKGRTYVFKGSAGAAKLRVDTGSGDIEVLKGS